MTLITGGARSGKSRYALASAEAAGRRRVYVATAEPLDEEMRRRIERHRAERGEGWTTIEEPVDLAGAIGRLAPETEVAVVDCLTVWLGNLVHRSGLAGGSASAATSGSASTANATIDGSSPAAATAGSAPAAALGAPDSTHPAPAPEGAADSTASAPAREGAAKSTPAAPASDGAAVPVPPLVGPSGEETPAPGSRHVAAGAADLADPRSFPEIASLLSLLDAPPCPLILVTNELGWGIVPDNALARAFRDLAGRVNEEVARRADRVVLMVAGRPLELGGRGG